MLHHCSFSGKLKSVHSACTDWSKDASLLGFSTHSFSLLALTSPLCKLFILIILHIYLLTPSSSPFSPSLHLTSCPSNKVTFPLPPLFSLFVNSCTKRVSQLCLSSRTEWLITWIVAFPSPSQSLSFAVFLSSASLSLSLFCHSSAAVTCQCQPRPSLFNVSLQQAIPLSVLTHSPSFISHILLFYLSPIVWFPSFPALYFLSLSVLPWQHSALSQHTETSLWRKQKQNMERGRKGEKCE